MSRGAAVRIGFASVVLALGMAFGTASGQAEIIAPQHHPPTPNDGWQAGTCYSDTPTCTVDSPPSQFFEQAAGHPQAGFTQFIIDQEPLILAGLEVGKIPVGNLHTVRVDLPIGLSVNPQATPEQCDLEAAGHPESCPADTKVGTSEVTATNPLTGFSLTLTPVNVYNLVPRQGEPARFGLTLLGNDVFLDAGVAWEGDYHEFFTIHVPKLELGGIPGLEVARLEKNRLVFDGRSGNGTFITTPTTCHDHESSPFEHIYSTFLRADSYEAQNPSFPEGSPLIESELPPGTNPRECDSVPYAPSLGADPGTALTDSPSGPRVDVSVPFEVPTAGEKLAPRTKQASSQTRQAKVTLPLGMGINPSAASRGLQTCTDAQFGKGTRNPVACPAASKIGVASVETPPLPPGSLSGSVYVGQQLSRDPTSGNEYRIFVDVESQRYGISARLVGNVSADPQTGQLTTTFDDKQLGGLPQVPFSTVRLDFDDGPTAVLTSPGACGPHTVSAVMTPWTGNSPATPTGQFSLSSAPGGGACPKSLAARPFAPSFDANTAKPSAGAFSPLRMDIARADGNQELKGVDVTLPPGLTAKLAGVRYCPAATLAAAAANSGAAEAADSSCPDSSLIGHADIAAGSGSSPIRIGGRAFLSGRYKNAPLSLAVVTPATAGPFDLGTVVVRVALFVDPRTAQVRAVADPIPHVYGGALLDIRSVAVKLDRREFSLNPTNCGSLAFSGSLLGGGANPVDPAAFVPVAVSAPFKANGCDALGFKPKLSLRLSGATRRAKNPRLQAVLQPREGDANIGRAAVTLPRSLFLDQSSIANVCTRVQFAANECPKDSVYGSATAFSPLLDGPLQGPVLLRSSDNTLPDLVVDLHGQVDVELDGRIDSVHGRIRNTFGLVPDVPVSKFVLTLPGGANGLLVNSRNLCPRKHRGGGRGGHGKKAHASRRHARRRGLRALVRFEGQNGKKANSRPLLRTPCGKKRHRHRG